MERIPDRIILDGRTYSGAAAVEHFRAVAADPLNSAWAKPVLATLRNVLDPQQGGLDAHTSGTTGPPKRLHIPVADLIASAELTAQTFGLRTGDRALLCLPADFIAGKMMVVRAAVLGLDLHAIDPRGSVLEKLRPEEHFHFAAMVPVQLHRAMHEDRYRVEEQFATILLGGGPVSQALCTELQGLRTKVFQGYGSTETVTHVAVRPLNAAASGSPSDTVEELVNGPFQAIGDITFGRDPRGCLVVYTPHLSTGQHVTNDLVELLDDTRFRWLGRWDNVILSGGKKIFPEQLEARTSGVLPWPHYFTSTPDERLGQAVLLVLEADAPSEAIMPEVMGLLLDVLQPHELPRKVRAVPSFRRTGSGKVIRDNATA